MNDPNEFIRWLQQTCHRAYHGDHEGLMESCPKDICLSTRQFFADQHRQHSGHPDSCPACRGGPAFQETAVSTPETRFQRNLTGGRAVASAGRSLDASASSVGLSPSLAVETGETGETPANEPLQSPPEARPEAQDPAALLAATLRAGFALRALQRLATQQGVGRHNTVFVKEAEERVAEFGARVTPSAHEATQATPDGSPEIRERLQQELNRLFERNGVENPLAGSPFAIPWAGRPPTEEECREALKAGYIWQPYVPLQVTAVVTAVGEQPERPKNFVHDDKSLCPTCNLYNTKDPHKPWCESARAEQADPHEDQRYFGSPEHWAENTQTIKRFMEEPFRRASGDVLCAQCGGPYRLHPYDLSPGNLDQDGHPFLNLLCDGSRVKL